MVGKFQLCCETYNYEELLLKPVRVIRIRKFISRLSHSPLSDWERWPYEMKNVET